MVEFLADLSRRPLSQGAEGLLAFGVSIGPGQMGREVAVYTAGAKPNSVSLRDASVIERLCAADSGSHLADIVHPAGTLVTGALQRGLVGRKARRPLSA